MRPQAGEGCNNGLCSLGGSTARLWRAGVPGWVHQGAAHSVAWGGGGAAVLGCVYQVPSLPEGWGCKSGVCPPDGARGGRVGTLPGFVHKGAAQLQGWGAVVPSFVHWGAALTRSGAAALLGCVYKGAAAGRGWGCSTRLFPHGGSTTEGAALRGGVNKRVALLGDRCIGGHSTVLCLQGGRTA